MLGNNPVYKGLIVCYFWTNKKRIQNPMCDTGSHPKKSRFWETNPNLGTIWVVTKEVTQKFCFWGTDPNLGTINGLWMDR